MKRATREVSGDILAGSEHATETSMKTDTNDILPERLHQTFALRFVLKASKCLFKASQSERNIDGNQDQVSSARGAIQSVLRLTFELRVVAGYPPCTIACRYPLGVTVI